MIWNKILAQIVPQEIDDTDYDFIDHTYRFIEDPFTDTYRPKTTDVRKLYIALETAKDRIDELEHEVARSSNLTYIEEAQEVVKNYAEDQMKIAKLEAALEKAEILRDFYKERMEELSNRIKANQVVREEAKMNPTQKDSSNKFSSADGLSKKEKIRLATAYRMIGAEDDYITESIGIKSVQQYINLGRGHYKEAVYDGHKMLIWDDQYDSDKTDLTTLIEEISA